MIYYQICEGGSAAEYVHPYHEATRIKREIKGFLFVDCEHMPAD